MASFHQMIYQPLTIALVVALLLLCSSDDSNYTRSSSIDSVRGAKEHEVVNHDKFHVLYINLDRSHERRKFMEDQLRFYGFNHHHRVEAVTEEDIVIPEEMSLADNCVSATDSTVTSLIKSEGIRTTRTCSGYSSEKQELRNSSASIHNMKKSHKIIITALCGRPKNSIRELVVTLSHLQAIRSAIYSDSSSPYSLILEDDTGIAFKINFTEMVETAPSGFGILQLVTSNDRSVKMLSKAYIRNTSRLWEPRKNEDHWCAGAYIINKAVLKPYIDEMFRKLANGWTGISVTAGYGPQCIPKSCCVGDNKLDVISQPIPPCINAPRGYQSDHFIFRIAMGRTYVSTLQLFTSATSSNSSTIHQHHVAYHQTAFSRINNGLREMVNGKIPLPSYVDVKYKFNELK